MTANGWIAEEPRFSTVFGQVLWRATRRPARVAIVAALATAASVGMHVSRPAYYTATVTLWMVEGDLQDPAVMSKPPARIREYILDVVLNRERLLALMKKYHISTGLRESNPSAAVESMSDDIDVSIVRNYFLLDRATAEEPRTAEINLAYTSGDRELARAVAHDLGQLFLESQAAERRADLSHARKLAAAELSRASEHLRALEKQHASLLLREASDAAGDHAELRGRVASLKEEIARTVLRTRMLEQRLSAVELADEAESQRLGLSIRLVDETVSSSRKSLTRIGIALYAAGTLCILLPLSAIVLGAFDRRLYRAADVTSHGFTLLAAVPEFPGAHAGSYRARMARARAPHTRRGS